MLTQSSIYLAYSTIHCMSIDWAKKKKLGLNGTGPALEAEVLSVSQGRGDPCICEQDAEFYVNIHICRILLMMWCAINCL
jgi:hypothetical protein